MSTETSGGGGHPLYVKWTEAELNELRAAYESAPVNTLLNLDALALKFGRHKTNVCRKARDLGLTNQKRPDVLERKIRERKFATKEEWAKAVGERVKKHFAEHGHPRGSLGMKHSAETKKVLSEKSKAMWANPLSAQNSPAAAQRRSDLMLKRVTEGKMNSGYSRTRGGKRADLGGIYFRSSWEANYARYLNMLVASGELKGWKFECKTFVFEAIKRGTRAYTPDFLIERNDGGYEWHEVKGWMDAASKTRLKRMAKYFPNEKIVLIDTAWFRDATRKGLPGIIKGWEGGTVR